MIKYSYTILYVEDVEKTTAFYAEAFGFTQKFITPDKDYAELETGITTLAFASYTVAEYNGVSIEKTDKDKNTPAFELTFVSDNIGHTFAQALKSGAILVKEPAQKPWGQKVGYVRDINGFLVEICTEVAK
jgi:lactoylglutathione lyase